MANLNLFSNFQQQLQQHLGNDYAKYVQCLQDWFAQRITKDFYDQQISSILQGEALSLHNCMIKQIILQCFGTPPYEPDLVPSTNTCLGSTITVSSSQHESEFNQVVLYQGGPSTDDATVDQEYVTFNYIDSGDLLSIENDVEDESACENVDADWLYTVTYIKPEIEDGGITVTTPPPLSQKKFPFNYAQEYQRLKRPFSSLRKSRRIVNVTHGYDISERLNRNAFLRSHFKSPLHGKLYLTTGSTLHGKFLLKCWERGLDNVDITATTTVVDCTKEHIRRLLTELIKERRAFRMRHDKICHSIGVPYPNPYLRQGHHLFEQSYGSDSAKMAAVLQVPNMLPPSEEHERLASLQIASCAPPKSCRFPSWKATLLDLLSTINKNPDLIPLNDSRYKLKELILQKQKGYGGNLYDEEEDEESSELLPACTY